MSVLAGIDFFTIEVLTWRGLATYYVLFLVHLETRRVTVAGLTRHPTEEWMQQMARNLTDPETGALRSILYMLHDRDSKFCASFRATLSQFGAKPLMLPPSSPNLNVYVERWVRSAKDECLSRLILFGEGSLRRALNEYMQHSIPNGITRGKATCFCFFERHPHYRLRVETTTANRDSEDC